MTYYWAIKKIHDNTRQTIEAAQPIYVTTLMVLSFRLEVLPCPSSEPSLVPPSSFERRERERLK